jgi:SAM-dependent methyltransferase
MVSDALTISVMIWIAFSTLVEASSINIYNKMDINQQAYSAKDIVERYAHYEELYKAELKIFDKYKKELGSGRILDIGIGGGRTTAYLAPISREYVGVDFAQPFVDHCKTKFASQKNTTIQYGDARDLKELKSGDFDFILFSFNGIDYVDMDGRKKVLSEFARLLRPGGILCFSFHNTGNIDKLYSFQLPRNPLKYLWEWRRTQKLKEINGDKETYRDKDWFIIKDGGENFTADTFYCNPVFQQKCLEDIGFTSFEFYNAESGEVLSGSNLNSSDAPWIYVTAIRS